MENNLLEHAVINEIEKDLKDKDFESLSFLLEKLISVESTKKLLIEYLSDNEREMWIEVKTKTRY